MSDKFNSPLPDDFGATLDRLRRIASQAASDGTVSEPAPHPDAQLLTLCAEVIDLHAASNAIWREARKLVPAMMGNPAYAAELANRHVVVNKRRSRMMRIPKIPAKTAAGVYAKAYVLKLSYGAAPQLAKSIATDLVACPGLRSALWPAGEAV